MNKREYSEDEAREILKRAVGQQEQDDYKYDAQQLFDMGREIGLSQDAIVKAEQEMGRDAETAAANSTPQISAEEAAFRRERLSPLKTHFIVFLAAIPLLFVLNLITSGFAFPWFLIAVSGWAMGLIGYYMEIGRMEGDAYEKAFAKWKRKRQQRMAQSQQN